MIDSEGKGYRLSGPRFRGCGGRDGLNRHSWLRRGVHFCRARRDGRGILTSVLGYFPARRTQIPTLAPRRAIYVVIPMTAVRSCGVRFGKAIIGCLTRVDRHYKDDEKRCQALPSKWVLVFGRVGSCTPAPFIDGHGSKQSAPHCDPLSKNRGCCKNHTQSAVK